MSTDEVEGQLAAEIVGSIEDGAAIYDSDDRLLHFNERYTQYFSLVRDILNPGISFREIFEAQADRGLYDGDEAGKQKWVDSRVKLFDDGAKANEFQRVDGSWVRIDYYKLPTGGTFVVTADISERKAGEAALRQSHERLEQMVEARTSELQAANERFHKSFYANPTAVAIAETSGVLYDVNDKWVEAFGYSREEALGKTAVDLGIWVDPAERDRAIASQSASGLLENFEVTFRARDGRIIHGLHASEYIEIDGRRMRLGITIDVTERKKAEQALKESDERSKSIIENSPAAIFLKDLEGRFIVTSSHFKEWFRISDGEVLGRSSRDLLPKEFADIAVELDAQTLATEAPCEREVHVPFADDSMHWVHINKFPVRDANGKTVGIGTINTDITGRREAEDRLRQAQKMEAVGQLTGGVAHDFNNLLAVILGNAELLAMGSDTIEPKLEAIQRAATRGSELTQCLLAYSRQQPLRPQTIDLGELATGMSEMLARTLGATIQVDVLTTDELWAASVDTGQVENALLNLAINSRDAMPDGGRLSIECINVQLDETYIAENPEALVGDFAVVAVTDTGTGMPEEVLARAFEPFFTTKEVGQGSGLGLSMVYGFTKQSGGHVSIYSEEGKGTTVKLYLPRAKRNESSDSSVADDSIPRGRGETVLVIEDDEDVGILATQVLEGLGYRVVATLDAVGARKILLEHEVSLVLSDVILPGGMSGPEFAAELGTTNPDLKVIFMSGYPAAAAKRNGFLGSDKVLLNKPFQRRELAGAVRKALDS